MAKVFLSAGHGGTDPGAMGNGLKEKDINLQIMLACRDELVRHGVTVVCSRTKDENDPVQQEVKEANASKADVAVSIHTNAGGGDGSETFYWHTSIYGKKLAKLMEEHMKAIGQNSRGVKTNNLMFTRETTMPAVLCECAFIDTKKDIAIVDTVAEQKKFGVAYAKAILEYFGIAYKTAATATTTTAATTSKASTCAVTLPVLSKGAKGEQVKAAQMLLKFAGCDVGSYGCDGSFGNDTVSAVKKLQKAEGLTQDGVIGAKTWAALLGA